MSWLKPEIIISAIIGILTAACTVGGTLLVTWTNSNVHTALSDDRMQTLQSDVKVIRDSIAAVPLYAQRLAQLEAWQGEQKSYNGSVDGRLRAVETTSANNALQLDNLTRASGIQLRK